MKIRQTEPADSSDELEREIRRHFTVSPKPQVSQQFTHEVMHRIKMARRSSSDWLWKHSVILVVSCLVWVMLVLGACGYLWAFSSRTLDFQATRLVWPWIKFYSNLWNQVKELSPLARDLLLVVAIPLLFTSSLCFSCTVRLIRKVEFTATDVEPI